MARNYYTTTEAAKHLAVSPDTVLKWVKAGKIVSYRTPGGHSRIPRHAVDSLLPARQVTESGVEESAPEVVYQYCWDFHAEGGTVKNECLDCIAYKSRAMRCYEMRDIPEEFGHLKLYCHGNCTACEYYKVMHGRCTSALLLTRSQKLIKTLEKDASDQDVVLRFASSEYECAAIIDKFRPDFVVLDCSLGTTRTRQLCRNLSADDRIPFTRIILASRSADMKDCSEGEIFGWIKKPFTYDQLKDCLIRVGSGAHNAENEN
ncbi:MAG: excisionase family DNA-binding protein [Candidatus Zixiibacteriota bacterium]